MNYFKRNKNNMTFNHNILTLLESAPSIYQNKANVILHKTYKSKLPNLGFLPSKHTKQYYTSKITPICPLSFTPFHHSDFNHPTVKIKLSPCSPIHQQPTPKPQNTRFQKIKKTVIPTFRHQPLSKIWSYQTISTHKLPLTTIYQPPILSPSNRWQNRF